MSNPHKIETVKCATCGVQKQACNHWFIVRIDEGFPCFACWPFDAFEELFPKDIPVCGQGCAQRQLELWMTKIRNAPQESIAELKRMWRGGI